MNILLENLLDEVWSLTKKIDAIRMQIETSQFEELPHIERILIVNQYNAMQLYKYALDEYIFILEQKGEHCYDN